MGFTKTLLLMTCSVAAFAATIPAGTDIDVRLGQTIRSNKGQARRRWEGTLASDLAVNGKTIAKKGAPVRGRVTVLRLREDSPVSRRSRCS